MLRNVIALDDRFAVTEAIYQSVLPDDSLTAAGQEGRLFLADFRQLEDIENGVFPHGPKYVYATARTVAVEEEVTRFGTGRHPVQANAGGG